MADDKKYISKIKMLNEAGESEYFYIKDSAAQVSADTDNMLKATDNGLKVSESDSISDQVIRNLFQE